MTTIFVGGSQRSGTTLLQRVLCTSAGTSPKMKEAGYLRMLMQSYQNALADFDRDTEDYFSTPADLRDFHGSVVSLFLNRTLSRHPGAEHLVLKEPHLTMVFPSLHEMLPMARFVLSIRNPIDTIASMVEVGRKMQEQGEKHFFQDRNIPLLCNHYKSFYAPALNYQSSSFREKLLLLRYEDLARKPEVAVGNLARFTGLQPRPENLEQQGGGAQYQDPRYQPWRSQLSRKGISAESVGAGKAVLTTREISEINRLCSDINRIFYPDENFPLNS